MPLWSRMFTNMKSTTISTISRPLPPPVASPTPEPPLSSATCIIHTSYDASSPPPQPAGWTRFVCISDTHSRTFAVPDGDVLLHTGDLTNTGTLPEMRTTAEWLAALPHAVKIVIAGNHDLPLHQADGWYAANWERWHRGAPEDVEPLHDLLRGEDARAAGLVYLEDERHEFQTRQGGRTWSVWGSPWSPEFYNWAFGYNRGAEADRLIRAIPQTDILLTHGPPHGILDATIRGQAVGCEALRAALDSGALRPRLHVFGHIHEAHGALLHGTAGTACVNAAAWPMGIRARGGAGFGTGAFAPVIVDLLDEPGKEV